MYLDTLVYILFVFYLLYQYYKTREKGNIAFLVPMSMMLIQLLVDSQQKHLKRGR